MNVFSNLSLNSKNICKKCSPNLVNLRRVNYNLCSSLYKDSLVKTVRLKGYFTNVHNTNTINY